MPIATEHKYPLSQLILTYLLMPGVALVSFGLGMLWLELGTSVVPVLFFLCAAWLVCLAAFGSLMSSSIATSDEAIAAYNYGRMLKSVRWQKIAKVKKVRRWNAGSRSYEDVFHVFDGEPSWLQERMVNLRGPIVFTDKISELRTLLNEINGYAREYRFSLVILDQEASKFGSINPVETNVAAF